MGLNDGLVAGYHLENTTDFSGNGNSLTYNGTTLVADKNGVANSARSFNGSSDYINIPNNSNLNPDTGDFSFGHWFKASGDTAMMISKYVKSSPYTQGYRSYIENGGDINVMFGDSDGDAVNPTSSGYNYNDNQWHYLVGVWDSNSKTGKLYIDGNLIDSQSNTAVDSVTNTLDLHIGEREGDFYFNGTLDEPRIYNRALTQDEVLQLYKAYDSEADSQVTLDIDQVAYYKLDGDVTDASGNGNNGTNDGTTFVTGKTNQGASFDGSSDYIDTGMTNTGSQFSVSLWIHQDDYSGVNDFPINNMDNKENGEFYVRIKGNKMEYAVVTSSGQEYVDSASNTLTNGNWYYITMTLNSNTLKGYINGVEKASLTLSGTYDGQDNSNIYIGYYKRSNYYYTGIIDEVGIWNRALSSTEVSELYNSGSGLSYPYSTTSAKKNKALFFVGNGF